MKIQTKVKKLIPQKYINQYYHLPKAVIANAKYQMPSRKLTVIGVTGTDGKTTTTNMIYQILSDAGKKVSMVSTINAVIGKKKLETGFHVTSPDPMMVQQLIKQASDQGSEYLVLETTSHGLDQHRFLGIKFKVGIITNITHEHLDYHKSFENYLLTKAKLIKDVKIAVLNKDDKSFDKLSGLTSGKIVSFGLKKTAEFNPNDFPLKLKILGEYNLYNALAAAAVASELGIDKKSIQKSLENFSGLEGRMQEIKNRKGVKVIVDFAHTPNGLEVALKALRSQTKGKVIVVFGCASERDLEKRPMMGKIAAKLADVTILTDEDPRFEDPMKIINEIAEPMYKLGSKDSATLFKEPNRKKAIRLGLKIAKRGDVIGIFGKGHEKSMNYNGVEKPWSDVKAVQQALHG